MKTKEQKRREAQERQARRERRTADEQINAILDRIIAPEDDCESGPAAKEMARLLRQSQ